jgi:hypothetical protein
MLRIPVLIICRPLTIDEWKIWNGAPFYYPGMLLEHKCCLNNF